MLGEAWELVLRPTLPLWGRRSEGAWGCPRTLYPSVFLPQVSPKDAESNPGLHP